MVNTEVKRKRSKEELLVALKEWSIAKGRIDEELANKYERNNLVSNPNRLAIP